MKNLSWSTALRRTYGSAHAHLRARRLRQLDRPDRGDRRPERVRPAPRAAPRARLGRGGHLRGLRRPADRARRRRPRRRDRRPARCCSRWPSGAAPRSCSAYAVLAARRAMRPAALDPGDARPATLRATLVACLAFTYLNPHVYLDTVLLLGAVASQHRYQWVFARRCGRGQRGLVRRARRRGAQTGAGAGPPGGLARARRHSRHHHGRHRARTAAQLSVGLPSTVPPAGLKNDGLRARGVRPHPLDTRHHSRNTIG